MRETLLSVFVFGYVLSTPLSWSYPGQTINNSSDQDPFACAILVAQTIPISEFKGDALSGIADCYLEAGRVESALELARSIDFVPSKIESLSNIAAKYSKEGRQDLAINIIAEAFNLARAFDPHDLNNRLVFTTVASGYVAIGKPEQALDVLKAVQGESHIKAKALVMISVKFADKGEFDKALAVISNIEPVFERSFALADVANRQIRSGARGQAIQLMDKALRLARKVTPISFRTRALTHISSKYQEIGQVNLASSVLVEALRTSRAIKDEDNAYTSQALEELAKLYAIYGKYEKAFLLADTIPEPNTKGQVVVEIAKPKYFGDALRVIQTINDNYVKAMALAGLGVKYAEAGKNKVAFGLLDQALNTARMVDDSYYKAIALADVGKSYSKVLQKEKGSQVLSSSLDAAKAVPDAYHQSRVLAIIGVNYIETGQTLDDSARRILDQIVSERQR